MDCNYVQSLIIDLIDLKLEHAVSNKMSEHIKKCDLCESEYIETGKILHHLNKLETIQPSQELRSNFYKMLKDEQRKQKNVLKFKSRHIQLLKTAAQIIILLAIGAIIGTQVTKTRIQNNEILVLKNQVQELNKNMHLTALSETSASQRIKAIQSVKNTTDVDDALLNALINTMNNDDNINVRMTAIYALSRYSQFEKVKHSLIESLHCQTDPLLQITLINILVNLNENRAKEPIQELLKNETIHESVKEQAKNSLQTFI